MTKTYIQSGNGNVLKEFEPDFVYQARILSPFSKDSISLRLQRNHSGDGVRFAIDRLTFECTLTGVRTILAPGCLSHQSVTEFRGEVVADSHQKRQIAIVINCAAEPETLSINLEGTVGRPQQLVWQITHDVQTGLIEFLNSCMRDATPVMVMQR